MGRVEIVTLLVTRHISSSLREVSTWRFREQIARSKKTPALQARKLEKLIDGISVKMYWSFHRWSEPLT